MRCYLLLCSTYNQQKLNRTNSKRLISFLYKLYNLHFIAHIRTCRKERDLLVSASFFVPSQQLLTTVGF